MADCDLLVKTLKKLERQSELLADAMRDTRRTAGWKGAEEVARAFDRINATCSSVLAIHRAKSASNASETSS